MTEFLHLCIENRTIEIRRSQGPGVFGILCLGLKLPIFQIPWCESVFGSFRSPSPIINITMKMIIMEGQQWNVKHVRKDGEKKDYIPTLLGHLIKYMFL